MLGPAPTTPGAPTYEAALAAVYDAVKAGAPAIRVAGTIDGAVTPNASLGALAAAYRSSGRLGPLMDELDFSPAPAAGKNLWPLATVPTLVTALGSRFAGTGQLGSALPLIVDGISFASAIPQAELPLYSHRRSRTTGLDEASQAGRLRLGAHLRSPAASDSGGARRALGRPGRRSPAPERSRASLYAGRLAEDEPAPQSPEAVATAQERRPAAARTATVPGLRPVTAPTPPTTTTTAGTFRTDADEDDAGRPGCRIVQAAATAVASAGQLGLPRACRAHLTLRASTSAAPLACLYLGAGDARARGHARRCLRGAGRDSPLPARGRSRCPKASPAARPLPLHRSGSSDRIPGRLPSSRAPVVSVT